MRTATTPREGRAIVSSRGERRRDLYDLPGGYLPGRGPCPNVPGCLSGYCLCDSLLCLSVAGSAGEFADPALFAAAVTFRATPAKVAQAERKDGDPVSALPAMLAAMGSTTGAGTHASVEMSNNWPQSKSQAGEGRRSRTTGDAHAEPGRDSASWTLRTRGVSNAPVLTRSTSSRPAALPDTRYCRRSDVRSSAISMNASCEADRLLAAYRSGISSRGHALGRPPTWHLSNAPEQLGSGTADERYESPSQFSREHTRKFGRSSRRASRR
jgi:hypothetical protein